MDTLDIDVVIPTHNGWRLTESCLHHLARQTVSHRVIIVDNASSDGTPERIRADFPEVGLVELGENRGYGAACNAGVAAGSAEAIVVLNNDVEAEPDFVERLVDPLFNDEELGSVAPLLLEPSREAIDSVGLTADATLAGFARLQGRPVTEAHTPRPALVGPSGGGAAYRRKAWEGTGGMDERIFMYHEDLDLALRLRNAGWRTTSAPGAVAVHLGSATAQRRSAWQRGEGGFGRGYVLRRYGVLRSRRAARALLTEALVIVADTALSHDLAALRGRLRGWRAGARLPCYPVPRGALDSSIGLLESLRLRRADYAAARG